MFTRPKNGAEPPSNPNSAVADHKNGGAPAANEQPEAAPLEAPVNELERLREILYGSQSRTQEQRLARLEARQETLRQELTSLVNDKISSLQDTLTIQLGELRRELSNLLQQQSQEQQAQLQASRKELLQRMDQQDNELAEKARSNQQSLNEKVERLAAESITQARNVQKELGERIDRQNAEQIERSRALQQETRQRDEALRDELTTLAAALDGKKISRQDMSQMLAELAYRLQSKND